MTFFVKENASLLALFLRLIDSAIIITSGIFCFYLLEPIKYSPSYTGYLPEEYLTVIVLGFIFSAWWFPAFNLYQSWRGSNISTEIRALLLGWSCSLLSVLAFVIAPLPVTKSTICFERSRAIKIQTCSLEIPRIKR